MIWPPPTITSLPGKRSYTTSCSWISSGSRRTMTFNGAIRHNDDLPTTKIRLNWDASNPRGTVRAEQKYIPPPRPLQRDELEKYRWYFGNKVAAWCEERMETQLGNGEYWTLANEALKAAAFTCRQRAMNHVWRVRASFTALSSTPSSPLSPVSPQATS